MIGIISLIMINHNQTKLKYIEYNGFKLALSVDGNNVTEMPSGNYFLVSYECSNGTILTWDRDTSTLVSDNINVNDSCYLEFESSPLLYDLVSIGDYIEYTGNNGCSGNQCSGWNASQTATDNYDNYGYCYSSNYKYYVYGWRVIHKTDNSVYIVSAGSPECVTGTAGNLESTKNSINSAALKYCNTSYLSGGVCDETTAHAINGDDFYKFTSQYYGSGRYLYYYNDGGTYGTPYCYYKSSETYCGYNNDLIDNGGDYWFAGGTSSSSPIEWDPITRTIVSITSASSTSTNGVRPVLKLDSSIRATGGTGTMTDPYTMTERVVSG